MERLPILRGNGALCIFLAEQALGTEPFKTSPAVQETRKQLPYIGINYDGAMQIDDDPTQNLQLIYLKFKSKADAKRARRRIVEEQHGGQWPPFAVSFTGE